MWITIQEALNMTKDISEEQFEISKLLGPLLKKREEMWKKKESEKNSPPL